MAEYYIQSNHVITAVRGDNFEIELNPGKALSQNEVVELHVMEPNQLFEDAIIRKTYDMDDQTSALTIIAEFSHDNTKDLTAGTYYYSVKLIGTVGTTQIVHTLIPNTKLLLVE